jgi:hypothetical protein
MECRSQCRPAKPAVRISRSASCTGGRSGGITGGAAWAARVVYEVGVCREHFADTFKRVLVYRNLSDNPWPITCVEGVPAMLDLAA